MDENEYRNAYQGINVQRCVFEKSILTLNCRCSYHDRFNLAEREAIRCTHEAANQTCQIFLANCRSKARFVLHLTDIVGNLLPHSKEIQVQKGALLGLTPDLPNKPDTVIEDIHNLLKLALQSCNNDPNLLPYDKLIQSISRHPQRTKLRGRNKTPQ